MLYNNPPAYGADFTPESIAGLCEQHDNLVAVKESSGDARRVSGVKALLGERIDALVGLDDMLVEAVAAGASGWVAGLVNAFPRESVRLFELAFAGEARAGALALPLVPAVVATRHRAGVRAVDQARAEPGRHGQ